MNDIKIQSSPDIKIFLIANKVDLEDRRVISKEMGEKFCTDLASQEDKGLIIIFIIIDNYFYKFKYSISQENKLKKDNIFIKNINAYFNKN